MGTVGRGMGWGRGAGWRAEHRIPHGLLPGGVSGANAGAPVGRDEEGIGLMLANSWSLLDFSAPSPTSRGKGLLWTRGCWLTVAAETKSSGSEPSGVILGWGVKTEVDFPGRSF